MDQCRNQFLGIPVLLFCAELISAFKGFHLKKYRKIYNPYLKTRTPACVTSQEPAVIHSTKPITAHQLHSKATPELQPPTIDNDTAIESDMMLYSSPPCES